MANKQLNNYFFIVFTSLCLLSLGHSTRAPLTEEKELPIDHVFVPKGFDDNDNVELVVSARLPNLCYKSPKVTAIVAADQKIHLKLTALLDIQEGRECEKLEVPFIKSAFAGTLTKNTYTVLANENTENLLKNELVVEEARSNEVNNYIYPMVHYVHTDPLVREITIKGHIPSDCFEVDKTEEGLDNVKFISNDLDTYAVLPILKQIRDFCPMKMTPVEFRATVPNDLELGVVLLHVRTMTGDAHNTLFQNKVE